MHCFAKLFVVACGLLLCITGQAEENSKNPREFEDKTALNQFRDEMVLQHHFNEEQLKMVFDNIRLHPLILDTIAKPAEGKPWREYRPIFITRDRISGGVTFLQTNRSTLALATEHYGVPPEIITAIVGVETRYGKHAGSYPVIDALSTLAFAYPPRSQFFRNELKQYLLMAREEKFDPLQLRGSYAGAMGMPQFIPSSFRRFAVDFDVDGKRDLWNSLPDIIGSVGNYFSRHGWRSWEPIATKVSVEGTAFQTMVSDKAKPRYSVEELREAGVIFPDEIPDNLKGSLLVYDSGSGPEYWVVWNNFYVITRYNHSNLYAMAVFQLSREIIKAQ